MYAIAVTDRTWFEHQRSNGFIDEVNFWTPSDWNPQRLSPGDYFVFKLRGSGDLVGGYGTFVGYKYQSLDLTWKEFGRKNGFDSKADFMSALSGFDSNTGKNCGCIILKDVVYFDEPIIRKDAGITQRPGQRFAYANSPFPFKQLLSSQGDFTLIQNNTKKGCCR